MEGGCAQTSRSASTVGVTGRSWAAAVQNQLRTSAAFDENAGNAARTKTKGWAETEPYHLRL